MNDAYDVSAWHDFAMGLAGASAALTGLVLVAMSIRLRAVLAEPIHRLRAESAFVSLLAVLGLALVALFAGISRQAYGSVVVAVALVRLFHTARDARLFVGEHERWPAGRHGTLSRKRPRFGVSCDQRTTRLGRETRFAANLRNPGPGFVN